MSEWNEGDLVEAVKGEMRIVSRLKAWDDGSLFLEASRAGVNSTCYDGYTMTLLERAVPKVELPTEPGIYEAADCFLTFGNYPYILDDAGRWFCSVHEVAGSVMPERMPLTRLEPVADTVRKVLDAVKAGHKSGRTLASTVEKIAAEFGGTDAV